MRILGLALVLWGITLPLYAQDIEPLLPQYTPCEVAGVRFACYTAEQQLQLNVLEESARTWRIRLRLVEQLRLDQAVLVENLTAQLEASQEIGELHLVRIEVLRTQLLEEIELKNRYRAEADSTDWWPLLVGGVLALISVGIGIGVSVDAASTSP